MVGSRGQTCARAGCPRNPCYGEEGSRTREFCSSHAPAGMVNVCHKTCAHEGCPKRPTYGVRELNRKEFCEAHSEPGMVNLNARCSRKGCYRMAGYGFRRKLCLHHNELEMTHASTPASTRALSPAAKIKKETKDFDSSRSTSSGKQKKDYQGSREVSRGRTSAPPVAATSPMLTPKDEKPISLSNAPALLPPPSPRTPATRNALTFVDMMKTVAATPPETMVAQAPPAVISSLMSSVASAAALLVTRVAAPKQEIKLEKAFHSLSPTEAAKGMLYEASKLGETGHGRRAKKCGGVKQENT